MKKLKSMMMLMAIAAASFTFTSCDDDDYWHDDYGWYDNYNHGDWGWNQGDWNNGNSQDDDLLEEAQALSGQWSGSVQLSELADDKQSRNNYDFDATMTFTQNNSRSLSGTGVEIDYATDGSDATQSYRFSWYVDDNGDIYIKYASGATYVMDAGASQYGFKLNLGDNPKDDEFYGYMIGTGTAKGDIMYIDMQRDQSDDYSYVRRTTRSGASGSDTLKVSSFGKKVSRTPFVGAVNKLPARR